MNASIERSCSVLVADPPWMHAQKATNSGHWGGSRAHYEPLTTAEIMRFPLPQLEKNAWLFLWRLHTHAVDALKVAEAWGFRPAPISELVWVKMTKDEARIRSGLGHSLRMAHEVCVVFKRGRPQRFDKGVSSVIYAPLQEHSRKPDEFYERVDRLCGPVPKVELFARRQYGDWECRGNQLEATT